MHAVQIAKPLSRTRPPSQSAQRQISPMPATGSTIERHAPCPCGGSCPRCQADDVHPRANMGLGTGSSGGAPIVAATPPIQCNPTVSSPSDPFEREADEMADKVTRMSQPGPVSWAPATIQRMCSECEDEEKTTIQAQRASSAKGDVALDTASAVQAAKHGGAPLQGTLRAFFEPRFGYDFGDVRVHADGEAAEGAHAVQARAYTMGRDIVFGASEYAPTTMQGKRLLAHELVHVVQQAGATRSAAALQRQTLRDGGVEEGASPCGLQPTLSPTVPPPDPPSVIPAHLPPPSASYTGCTAAQNTTIETARTTALSKSNAAATAMTTLKGGTGSATQQAALTANFGALTSAQFDTAKDRYTTISTRLGNAALFACGAAPAQAYCGPPQNWCAGTPCPTTADISYLCPNFFTLNCAEPNFWSIMLHESGRAAGCCPPDVQPSDAGYPPAAPACLTNVYSYSSFARAI